MTSVYDFSARAIDGTDVSLDRYRGQALLIVNMASKCGFTGQYDGLEKLHRDFVDAPFEVLGFPCNQFGQQEPGRAAEIAAFCATSFDVTFPLFDRGQRAEPAPPLCLADPAEARLPRLPGHQVELHQVPDRPRRPRRRALFAPD